MMHRRLHGHARPGSFDRNLVVIGGGSAGLVSAYIAAALKARVTLVEKDRMGGDCLNTGCVPSKALLRSADFARQIQRAPDLGFRSIQADFDLKDIMQRVQRVMRTIEPHDSAERYTRLGVECLHGAARITSPWRVEVEDRPLTTRNIVLATGARPFVPALQGIEHSGYLTSDTIWQVRERPGRLLVLGGGAIGCEMAQAFARLGSRVVLVEMLPRILPREDEDVSARLAVRLAAEGVELRTGYRVLRFERDDGSRRAICVHRKQEVAIEFDTVLVAIGRRSDTEDLGLDAAGVALTEGGAVRVDDTLRTTCPTIYACGDVAGPYQFTHTASHQAWYATVNALLGGIKRFRVDYSVIPWATFTDPEVARVGLNEQEAKDKGIPHEVTTYDIADLDRAITDEAADGMVKVLTPPGRDRILGATIVGSRAGELIAEYVLAMKHGLGLKKILGTIHVYPTLMEANRFAAGNWRRAHTPEGLLRWVERFHRWRRGG